MDGVLFIPGTIKGRTVVHGYISTFEKVNGTKFAYFVFMLEDRKFSLYIHLLIKRGGFGNEITSGCM